MSLESDPQFPPLQFKGEIMDFDLGLDIDHRKRRRNRTTQSCLNCHTSKRKCDRKRPCQRCIQLGLTGLCVYEVDDPALRDDPNIDETTRLRNRIAELESLVRELRGKPHPKWAEPNYCDGDATEKWHSRSSKRLQPQYQKNRPSEGTSSQMSSVVKSEQTAEYSQHQLYRLPAASNGSPTSHESHAQPYYRNHPQQTSHQPFGSPSDESTVYYSSSSSNSPLDYGEHRYADGSTHSNGDHYSHQSYARPTSSDTNGMRPSCSCLTNPEAAHPLIALTNQLRDTLQQLRQLPEHNTHNECLVLSQILELDDTMHGGDVGYPSDPRYTALPTPTESELMSPASSSSHSSLGHPIHEWPGMAAHGGYDHYFQVSSAENGAYQKAYHVV